MNSDAHPQKESLQEEVADIRNKLRAYFEWLQYLGIRDVPGPSVDRMSMVENEQSSPKNMKLWEPSFLGEKEELQKPVPGRITLVQYPSLPDPVLWQGQAGLDQIRDVLGDCKRCALHHHRKHIVFGQGDPSASLVFVGEGPGAEEDRTGFPFVGAAGDLLNRMIAAMGFSREQVYICNVVKCRPPGNRTPESDEVSKCGAFLRAQLQTLRPKVIVALGATPSRFLLDTTSPMSRIRGQFASYDGMTVMPTYHPAYLLRTPSAKKMVWEDLKQVMTRLNQHS